MMQSSKNEWVDAARAGNTRIWTYMATLGIVIAMLLIWESILAILLFLAGMSDLLLLAISLLSFAAIPAGLWLGLRFIHRRSFLTLFGSPRRFRWPLFLASGGVWLLLGGLSDLFLSRLQPGNYTLTFDPARFFPYALVAVFLLPLQVLGEELLFRAYLTQAVGVKTGSFLLAWAVPSLIFGLLHLANPEVSTYGWGWTLPLYLGLGLLLGWVTLRSSGLEAALGLHLANNLYAVLCVTMAGSALPSPALFTIRAYDPRVGLAVFAIGAALYLLILGLTRRKTLLSAGLAALFLLSACAPAQVHSTSAPSLPLADCVLSRKGFAGQFPASCGSLEVPENPDAPAGRKIRLNVAVVKATGGSPAADPVFLLAGGPGQAATEAYLPLLPSLGKISLKHDLVLVDQRGTGKSNPLACGDDLGKDLPSGRLVPTSETVTAFKDCLAKWDADTRFYNTSAFARDLEAVRLSLGYGPIDLLGVSYGTRAALAYAKAYPASVRAMVLDGVVPPGWVLGQSIRRDAARALDLIFARCQSEPGCLTAFPDLKGDLTGLLKHLQEQPQTVQIKDPISGEDKTVEINDVTASGMLRLITYSSDYSALLPLLVHTAAQGNLEPLAAQWVIADSSDAGLYMGLYYSVVCSEDKPFFPSDFQDNGYLTMDIAAEMRAVCAVFPANPQPEGERAFPALPIPALIISGEADPVTPPENGAAVAKLLPNSKSIVVKGMGHGNSTVGCIPNLIRQLFEEGSTGKIDTTCVERAEPPALFTRFVGPEP